MEDSLFGCPALTHNGFQRFNFRSKTLCFMSFVAQQARHNESMHQLLDGTVNYPDSCAFSASMVDNDTYFYNQAIYQPDCPSFIKAMVKEVDDPFHTSVWQLW
jgi:hypothetical protein